ncbi:unnamed protein product [Vitrella brassicaformis CCMP3155]|uniref:Glucose-methanol-choline oxidoreductase N-terminal domain-containing protein n=1 Tax=Vitrella brassicaformis (strain CCMP3155) TaxID=1169540 RepID=A0A0G4GB69_VITBC|nr:unnamed protein product [Vitrella brassicaformis CCMP3155]|eukprot:CEM26374.1 unnamed protein product [Vitrella brassicaformis CCMP3155]
MRECAFGGGGKGLALKLGPFRHAVAPSSAGSSPSFWKMRTKALLVQLVVIACCFTAALTEPWKHHFKRHPYEETFSTKHPPNHLEDVRDADVELLEALFAQGEAYKGMLIPSWTKKGEPVRASGLPCHVVCGQKGHFPCPFLAEVQHTVWGGKVFHVDHHTGMTTLENVRTLGGKTITAEVYENEGSKKDGRPSVIFDYSKSLVATVSQIIDEIRLVNKDTLLYLGKSYMIQGMGKEPVLLAYFALEFDALVDKKCDHIVVGGGAAGTGLAFTLAESGYDVCIYERGDYRTKTYPGQTIDGFSDTLVYPKIGQIYITTEGVRSHVANILSGGTALSAGIHIEEEPDYYRYVEREFSTKKGKVEFYQDLVDEAFEWIEKSLPADLVSYDPAYTPHYLEALIAAGLGPDRGSNRKVPLGAVRAGSLFENDGKEMSPHRERRGSDVLLWAGDPSKNGGSLTVRVRQTVLELEFDHDSMKGAKDKKGGRPKAVCIIYADSPDKLPLEDSLANQMGIKKVLTDEEKPMNRKRQCVSPGGEIWMAAGAVLSPVLMMRSGVGPKDVVDKLMANQGKEPVMYMEELGKKLFDRNFVPLSMFLKTPSPATIISYAAMQLVGDHCPDDKHGKHDTLLDIGETSKHCTYINQEEVHGGNTIRGLIMATRAPFPPHLRSLPEVDFLEYLLLECVDKENSVICAPVKPLLRCLGKAAGTFGFSAVVKSRGYVTVNEHGDPVVSGGYYNDPEGHDLFAAVEALKRSIRMAGSGAFDDIVEKKTSVGCPAVYLSTLLNLIALAGRRLPGGGFFTDWETIRRNIIWTPGEEEPLTAFLGERGRKLMAEDPFVSFLHGIRDRVLQFREALGLDKDSPGWLGDESPAAKWLLEEIEKANDPPKRREMACDLDKWGKPSGPECGDMTLEEMQIEHAKDINLFPPLPKVINDHTLAEYVKTHGSSIWHWTGSAPMGTIVDSHFRVFDMDGLNICDASIFPDITRMNVQAQYFMVGRYCGLVRRKKEGWGGPHHGHDGHH